MRTSAMVAILVALGITGTALQAQEARVDRGAMIVGGGASVSSSGVEGGADRTTSFNLSPKLLYHVAPGFGLGGSLGISYLSSGGSSTTVFGLGPIARYWFSTQGSNLPYAEVWLDYTTVSDAYSAIMVQVGIGISVMLGENLALEPDVTYGYRVLSPEGVSESQNDNVIGVGASLTAFVF